MKNLRTPAMYEKYKRHLETLDPSSTCPLCDRVPTAVFTHWKIIPNHFPYDLIADTHDMLVPLRHVTEQELSEEEREELFSIKEQHLTHYHYIIEATLNSKSLPSHFHLHVIVGKERN